MFWNNNDGFTEESRYGYVVNVYFSFKVNRGTRVTRKF